MSTLMRLSMVPQVFWLLMRLYSHQLNVGCSHVVWIVNHIPWGKKGRKAGRKEGRKGGRGEDGLFLLNCPLSEETKMLIKTSIWTSLVAQWLRICLPMQGTRVRALVWEDPTCCGATKPVCHNYWSLHALEPATHNYWAHAPQLLKPAHLEPVLRKKRSHRNEKPAHCNEE